MAAWVKGQSGNPKGGQPKRRVEVKELAAAIAPEAMATLRVAMAAGGTEGVSAAGLVLAYAYGRPVQTQNLRVIRALDDLTEAELRAIVARGPPLIEGEAEEVAPDGEEQQGAV